MPVEYFETEPTKKQPPDLLERVLDTTEHHEHAVDETNSAYMQQYRQGYEIGRMLGRARAAATHRVKAEARRRVRKDILQFLGALAALSTILWILAAVTISSNHTAATTQATPTPTPTAQKTFPHKAVRGQRRSN